MNKPSKTFLAMILLISGAAYSKNNLISREFLNSQNFDPSTLDQLLKEKIIFPANNAEFFILDEMKVDQVIAFSKDQELNEFLIWLKSISGNETEINQKKPGDMTPATQDIKA